MRGFTPGKHSFEDYGGALSLEVDVAVLGAGAGGAAAAYALAQAGHTVAVIEEGRHWRQRSFSGQTLGLCATSTKTRAPGRPWAPAAFCR